MQNVNCYDCHNLKKDSICKIYGTHKAIEELKLTRMCDSFYPAEDIYSILYAPVPEKPTIYTTKEIIIIIILIIIATISATMEIT